VNWKIGRPAPKPPTTVLYWWRAPAERAVEPLDRNSMKILTAAQMRRIDRLTTERAGVPSLQLMEQAGRQVVDFLLSRFTPLGRVTVLCGKGNNGGDGLVVARLLRKEGHKPAVVLLADPADLKGDACANYDACRKAGGQVESITTEKQWQARRGELLDCDVLVDALLGTGLKGSVRGLLAQVIGDVNAARGLYRILSVDIPSGLASDSGEPAGEPEPESIQADACVTFTAPKRGHIFPPNCLRVGTLAVAPIGTPEDLYAGDEELFLHLITARQFAQLPLRRDPQAHKGSYGHALLVAGSRGKTGAAVLAGKAALRTGAGLVTVATPASVLSLVAVPVPECMTEPLAETDSGTVSKQALDYGRFQRLLEGKNVLALGPGLSTHPQTVEFVRLLLKEVELPLVLDADALNALVGALECLKQRKSRTVVLTPHPGEMARLLGVSSDEVQRNRVEVAQRFARDFDAFVILKGFRTLVAAPDGSVYVNPTGGPGLAKGGAGDVLTGVVAGALAQFADAAVTDILSLAVYLHGSAGDCATAERGEQSLLAGDIIESLPAAWRALRETVERDDQRSYYLLP